MEIWLIENGEKSGPFPEFEVRGRIHSGELTAERKIWHLDLDRWTPLEEVELFADEFRKQEDEEDEEDDEEDEPTEDVIPEGKVTAENVDAHLTKVSKELGEDEESGEQAPPPLPKELHLWRRFGARWFDFILYSLLLTTVLVFSGADVFELSRSTAFAFISILPWFFLESLSTAMWGTTPGKWLTGLVVRDREGKKLSAGQAILRTMRVIIVGMGFGQPLLILICHLIAAWLGFKRKIVLWDTPAGIEVSLRKPLPEKWIGFGVGLFLMLVCNALLMLPIMGEMPTDHLSPEQKEQWEQFFPPTESSDEDTA
jgi:uncharacterized RDD family membrane protein YckC